MVMMLMNLMERKLDSLKIRDLYMIQVDLTYYVQIMCMNLAVHSIWYQHV